MKMKIEFVYEDDGGNEIEASLPAKHEVCGRCEGYGTHLTPSIGEHAYSMEEFHEAFSDDEDREAYFQRGGKYDVVCEDCNGKRVVLVVDEKACERNPELKELVEIYYKYVRAETEYEWVCAAERKFGC